MFLRNQQRSCLTRSNDPIDIPNGLTKRVVTWRSVEVQVKVPSRHRNQIVQLFISYHTPLFYTAMGGGARLKLKIEVSF